MSVMPNVDFIIRFESGEVEEEELIAEFQKMINSGLVWQLQGFYGRTAKALIDNGLCTYPEKPTKDFYGNSIPVKE